ncbi:peptidase M28 [Pseudalgibacter alginicilyticus]|uniref:Peptidase M28 n=1 Tax=Pseudalgibacter alginicilyticus TaxID=1736674 RepID=A0A0P0CCY6_9FLAO|nr:M28 family metallopeptidase [Pseudalgibacter alginicilyticus]ALJ03707.1 peptidase M28 [Pseudalgibacter alginicilyticus]
MKTFCILSAFALVGKCATTKYTTKIQNLKDSIQIVDSSLVKKYANTITAEELSLHLYAFSSDKHQGRKTGEIGQKLAAEFLKSYYQNEGINSPLGDSIYYQVIPKSFFPKNIESSENVLAYIKGTEKPDEIIIISAHLDHLGLTNEGQIYYGADDDGSGTVAIMEIAQAFKQAKTEGYGPKRSILFLHLTAEELGKLGSDYYTQNPIFPLKNTVANLNIDMIGRVDRIHKENKNYMYLIGSDRLSKELHYLSEKINNTTTNINLDYRYNELDDENNYYSRSDHYNFAKHGIPVIFYFNGEHKDYHRETDTPDKIDYELLKKRTKLIFATAWQIANQENRIKVDKSI